MAVGRVFVVHAEKLVLILLSRILVIKSHLHESKTATSLSLPVTHHNGVDHDAKLLKVVNEIALLGLIGQAANKQFDFMIWSLQIEIINMSLRSRNENISCVLTHHGVHSCRHRCSILAKLIELHI